MPNQNYFAVQLRLDFKIKAFSHLFWLWLTARVAFVIVAFAGFCVKARALTFKLTTTMTASAVAFMRASLREPFTRLYLHLRRLSRLASGSEPFVARSGDVELFQTPQTLQKRSHTFVRAREFSHGTCILYFEALS